VSDANNLGPLAALVGAWEGDQGIDVSFNHAKGESLSTPYYERRTYAPLGPVGNGTQELYGLDYRMESIRKGEDSPFHTEVGYWLWDAATSDVIACVVVPRGMSLIAGGKASADASKLSLTAERGSTTHGILANGYLDSKAQGCRFSLKLTISGDTLSYEQDTVLSMSVQDAEFHHTDVNTLKKVS
jgi:hypothetical protein